MGIDIESTQSRGQEQFGNQFRALRRRLGLRQGELGANLDLSARDISRLERNLTEPPREPEFYSRLISLEGVRASDVGRLLHEGGPLWAFEQVVPARAILTPLPGVIIPLYFDHEEMSDDELEVFKSEMTSLVRNMYGARMERAEQSGVTTI